MTGSGSADGQTGSAEKARRDLARRYLRAARVLIGEGKAEAASDLLSIARDLSPGDHEIAFALADAYHRQDREEEARALWSALVETTTNVERVRSGVFRHLAQEAWARGAGREAAEHLADHLRLDLSDDLSANQLLLMKLASAPSASGAEAIATHVAEFGRPSLIDLALAIHVERHDDPVGAAARISAEPNRFTGQPDFALAAADALEEMGETQRAVAFLEAMERLFPRDNRFVRQRMRVLSASGTDRQVVAKAADVIVRRGRGAERDRVRKMRLLAGIRNWAAVVDEAEALLKAGIFDATAASLAIRGYTLLERDEERDRLLARCEQELGSGRLEDRIALARLEIAADRATVAAARLVPLYEAISTRTAVRADYAEALVATGYYAAAWPVLSEALHTAAPSRLRRLTARCAAAMGLVPDPRARFPDALFEAALKLRRAVSVPSEDVVVLCTSTLAAGGAERQVALTAARIADRRGPDRRTVLIGRDLGAERGNAAMLDLACSTHLEIEDMAEVDPAQVFRRLCAEPTADRGALKLIAAFPEELSHEIVKLYARFLALRPRVVHLWQDGRIGVGTVAAVLAGVPRIVASVRNLAPREGDRRRYRPFLAAMYPVLARRRDVVLTANSAAGATDYERVYRLAPGSVVVLRNGIDGEEIRKRAPAETVASVRARLGLAEEDRLVGGVFRLAPAKRPDLWLDVARRVAAQEPRARFVIVGAGVLRDELEAAAAAHGLDGRLVFAGSRNPVEPWIAAMDLMLLVSRVEGVPNVVLDAAALGIPVVATAAGGTAEAILDGQTGRLMHDDGPETLAAAVLVLLRDGSALADVRRRGPDFVEKRFGMARMIDETMAVYGLGGGTGADEAPGAPAVRLPRRRWPTWMRTGNGSD